MGAEPSETDLELRAEYAKLTRDELIDLLCEQRPEGAPYVFAGKAKARRTMRLVQPRGQHFDSALSAGDEEAQSRNLFIESECLQAVADRFGLTILVKHSSSTHSRSFNHRGLDRGLDRMGIIAG